MHRRTTAVLAAALLANPGAAGMALSEDGSTLYAALSGADAVSALDTSTLTEMARYATGMLTDPASARRLPSSQRGERRTTRCWRRTSRGSPARSARTTSSA